MRDSKTKMWPLVGLFLLLPACGDDGGGGSGGGGGTGDGGDGTEGGESGADDESGDPIPDPDPPPDAQGDQCGGDVLGWETRCLVEELEAVASDRGEIPGVPEIGAHTQRPLCCEGQPSIETADEGCHGYCMLELCEAALADHVSRCDTCLVKDCGFDMTNCLDGGTHNQIFACLAPLGGDSYTLTASCTAINNEDRNPDGSFFFLQQPLNDTMDDPDICRPTDDLELDPPRGLGQFKASAGEGTVARVTWSMADMSGEESTDDLDVLFQYGIMPCATPSSDCLELTALELTLPTTSAMGMTITQAKLSVVAVEDAPVLERGERFNYPEGAIRVLMQAQVNGFPLVLTGTNVGRASGSVSPEGDQFSLSGLRFEYSDSVIAAALEIEIQGQYDARRPNAQITRSTAPQSCDEPVTLLATSWDVDQDALTHTWWVRDIGSFKGPLLEVVLPAGEHDVMLTSRDPSGLVDTATLRYARTCR